MKELDKLNELLKAELIADLEIKLSSEVKGNKINLKCMDRQLLLTGDSLEDLLKKSTAWIESSCDIAIVKQKEEKSKIEKIKYYLKDPALRGEKPIKVVEEPKKN